MSDTGQQAKKYPLPGKIKGSIYGTPEVSSILASFESGVIDLHNQHPDRAPNSKAYAKHWDDIRLEAASRIMGLQPTYQAEAKSNVHPEEYCHRCGGPNISWSAPSPLWNKVIRDGSKKDWSEIICPTCFATLAIERGVAADFRLYAITINSDLETVRSDGKVWDEKRWLWVDEPVPVDSKLHDSVGLSPVDGELTTLLEFIDRECIGSDSSGSHGFNYDKAQAAVAAHLQAAVREARIDELINLFPKYTDIQFDGTNGPGTNTHALSYINERLQQLKQGEV